MKHRKILGERLAEARAKGSYARLNYDKLIVDGQTYKYDERTNEIVRTWGHRVHQQPIRNARERNANEMGRSDQSTPNSGSVHDDE